ncbi:Alpha-1,3/1,6-mannosyltransferase ALG2 [Smittium mucronatum]|uniref:Alpha-1,3/1,6-mannosyltransferase ALG2 n=1 Tax=Smittium mucronatum TaxID=133383 RepID=A0A1R0H2N1_9FUNG|nr:Alpha-1,3/1,6-mannosyltransferase ALG2 [Smittium mucronatum]
MISYFQQGTKKETMEVPSKERKLKIAFVHPNLGIGGAERLVVDSALSLQKLGHKVVIYTMYHDEDHSFKETYDGTLEVRVRGDYLFPKSIFNKFHILLTSLQSMHLAFSVLSEDENYDVLFVDQLSAPIPILKISQMKVLFYCHFPDKLQARHDTILRKIYRSLFDLWEELSMKESDLILVNSRFTQNVFYRSFRLMPKLPKVLYPGVNFNSFDKPVDMEDPQVTKINSLLFPDDSETRARILLSINRFERKKNLPLAIKTFSALLKSKPFQSNDQSIPNLVLIMAGGYDPNLPENVQHFSELIALANSEGLNHQTIWPPSYQKDEPATKLNEKSRGFILFLPSFSDNVRSFLFKSSTVTLYTPQNEHFGLVPVESMYMSVPVIAVRSGGPRETIIDGRTGFLCRNNPDDFAEAALRVLQIENYYKPTQEYPLTAEQMGVEANSHVKLKFSLDTFSKQLNQYIHETLESSDQLPMLFPCLVLLFALLIIIFITLIS